MALYKAVLADCYYTADQPTTQSFLIKLSFSQNWLTADTASSSVHGKGNSKIMTQARPPLRPEKISGNFFRVGFALTKVMLWLG